MRRKGKTQKDQPKEKNKHKALCYLNITVTEAWNDTERNRWLC